MGFQLDGKGVKTMSSLRKNSQSNVRPLKFHSRSPPSSSQLNNFFKDLLDSAFENDPNLSSDKSKQQLEGSNDENNDIIASYNTRNEKTEVQKRWLESQKQEQSRQPENSASSFTSTLSSTAKGAPINPEILPGSKWELSFYLTGVPNFDPNNSLYGSKVNISTRKDSNMAKDGFAIGADSLPSSPSTTCTMTFQENGICYISESPFTNEFKNGEWLLSEDCKFIRFSLDVKGYQRTVTTKGTIQNVAWTDRDEAERKSSASYSIDEGIVYAEASIGYGSTPGVLVMAIGNGSGNSDVPGGLLKVEKKMGVFGLSSKLMSCGKFSARMIVDEEDETSN